MSAATVIAAARECLETPFHHQGRQPGVGIDCAGLIVHAFAAAGHKVTDDTRYAREPDPGRMRRVLDRVLIPASGEWEAGDILYCRIVYDPQHLALWTGHSIIHAYYTKGKVIEHGLDAIWTKRLVARYRHPELIDE